jgi:hypothetical protein
VGAFPHRPRGPLNDTGHCEVWQRARPVALTLRLVGGACQGHRPRFRRSGTHGRAGRWRPGVRYNEHSLSASAH